MSNLSNSEASIAQLKVMLRGRVRNLTVLTCEGRVVLQGLANSYHAKQLAQHFVLKLLEGRTVINEIAVKDDALELPAASSDS